MSLIYYLSGVSPIDECAVFKAASEDTWARIRFSRLKPGLKIHETTVTQNLVYEMALLRSWFPHLGFTLFESTAEYTHGDDLELCILQHSGHVITYAMQAKILYHQSTRLRIKINDGKYPQMRHYVGATRRDNQVQLLLDYATDNGFIPLYLLYNYVLRRPLEAGSPNDWYGCTVVTANYLRMHHGLPDGNLSDKVKFTELHPLPALPWHKLICTFSSFSDADLLKAFDLSGLKLSNKNVESLYSDPLWLEVNLRQNDESGLSQKDREVQLQTKKAVIDTAGFSPRFRLLVQPSNQQ